MVDVSAGGIGHYVYCAADSWLPKFQSGLGESGEEPEIGIRAWAHDSYPIPLDGILPVKAQVSMEKYLDKSSLRVVDSGMSNNTGGLEVAHAKIRNLRFHNGAIELELAAKPLPQAGELARGFVGIAFRIADDESKFECIYLRPPMVGRRSRFGGITRCSTIHIPTIPGIDPEKKPRKNMSHTWT